MLILTRRVGEKFIIDDNSTITILKIGINQVKIGIKAPKYVLIYREELFKFTKK